MAISLRAGLSMPRPPPAREAAIRGPDVVGVPQKQFQQGASTMKEIKLVCSITRRDAMSYLFAAFLTISTGNDTVEARSMKPETRRKIREKLNKLREKGGVPKEKINPIPDMENPPINPENRVSAPLVEPSL